VSDQEPSDQEPVHDGEPIDLTAAIGQSAIPVLDEMHSRLDGGLSENDELAIASAITKAITAGMDLARSIVDIALWRHGLNVELELNLDAAIPDAWAERYGEHR
jgi:hypothetical protein